MVKKRQESSDNYAGAAVRLAGWRCYFENHPNILHSLSKNLWGFNILQVGWSPFVSKVREILTPFHQQISLEPHVIVQRSTRPTPKKKGKFTTPNSRHYKTRNQQARTSYNKTNPNIQRSNTHHPYALNSSIQTYKHSNTRQETHNEALRKAKITPHALQ